MRSSNIKIWLSNTRWVACLHSTSLARPPDWPEDKVKVNKFIWTYSSATKNISYQSCFRTTNIRGIFCLSYPFPPYISQTVIFFADLHRYVNSENWGVDQTTSFFSFSSPMNLPLYWYHIAGGNVQLKVSLNSMFFRWDWSWTTTQITFMTDMLCTLLLIRLILFLYIYLQLCSFFINWLS